MNEQPEAIPVRKAARLLDMSPTAVYNKIKCGQIEAIRIGGTIRVLRRPLMEKLRLSSEATEVNNDEQ